MNPGPEELDQLTRRRLGRLGQAPVDTSNLEKRLEATLWQQSQQPPGVGRGSSRRLAVLAATVAIAAGAIFLVIQGANTPAVAAPVELARLHRNLVAARVPMVPVGSIEQASRYLRTEWTEAPPLPDPSAATVTACCRHSLQNRKVACILLDYHGQPVTMAVGHDRDLVCGARHENIVRNGKHYAVHESDGLRMVMTENKGRWVCLMSPLSIDSLMELADSLRF